MNYNIKLDLTKLIGAKVVSDPQAGEGIFIPAGGPVEVSDGGTRCTLSLVAFELKYDDQGHSHLVKPWLSRNQAFGMTTKALMSIPYVGNMRSWDRSSNTPGPGCRSCRWAEEAKYTSGVSFIRCNHPQADWGTTRDVRHSSTCPEKNENQTR